MPSTDKDTKKVLKAARKQGFEVHDSSKGYPLVFHHGTFVMKCSQTPSDPRAVANMIATLRRFGFQWPPRGKGGR